MKRSKITPRRVAARVRWWRDLMGLSEYEVGVTVGEIPPDPGDETGAEADCEAHPEYFKGRLRFDPAKIDPEELNDYVTHELLHIPTWELVTLAELLAGDDKRMLEIIRRVQETMHTRLERIVMRVARRGGLL